MRAAALGANHVHEMSERIDPGVLYIRLAGRDSRTRSKSFGSISCSCSVSGACRRSCGAELVWRTIGELPRELFVAALEVGIALQHVLIDDADAVDEMPHLGVLLDEIR